jgi:hypothetical protein
VDKAQAVPAGSLASYGRLVAAHPRLEIKGAAMPYTSMNGHMFSFLTRSGALALRLPAAEREAFLERYGARLCEQHGVVMKEYVEVPGPLLAKTRELGKYFAASVAYVASLPPKPTRRGKKRAGK